MGKIEKIPYLWGEWKCSMENRFKQARTVYNRHGVQSTKEVEKATGVTKSLIEDLESNVGKRRNVGYLTIKKLSEYYGVTSDYLLGLTNTPTIDAKFRAICDYTGLSSRVVEWLHGQTGTMWIINGILENEALPHILNDISKLEETWFNSEADIYAPPIAETPVRGGCVIDNAEYAIVLEHRISELFKHIVHTLTLDMNKSLERRGIDNGQH